MEKNQLISLDCEFEIPKEYYNSNNFETFKKYMRDKLAGSNLNAELIENNIQHRIRLETNQTYVIAAWGAGYLKK